MMDDEEREYLRDKRKETGEYTNMFRSFSREECEKYMLGVEKEASRKRSEPEEILWKRHLAFISRAFTKRKGFLDEEESYRIWKNIVSKPD